MDWQSLAKTVIGLGAPSLGQALGGPLGAAAGKVLAGALGAAEVTPVSISAAIVEKGADPSSAAEAVRRAEAEWAAAMAQVGMAQVAEVGATMRAEIASNDLLQRCWRPIYALELTLIECPGFALTILHALWTGHEPGIAGFGNLAGLLMAYFGARFGVLGIYVNGRSREKRALAGVGSPSAVVQLANAVAKFR